MSFKILKTVRVGKENMEIINFLKSNIEPLGDSIYGAGYRAAVYLTDGTYLPCVIFRNSKKTVKLAIKRFKEKQSGRSIVKYASNEYYETVKNFVTKGNCINDYDIASVEISKYAFPISILKQIEGETGMGWTGFAAKMKNDQYFGFSTGFGNGFFQIPENYSVEDIVEIVNHRYVSKTGELRPFYKHDDDYNAAVIYSGRPFFECYMDNL